MRMYTREPARRFAQCLKMERVLWSRVAMVYQYIVSVKLCAIFYMDFSQMLSIISRVVPVSRS